MIAATLGNVDLLKLNITAFLCSRKVPARAVLKCYDWAIAQREQGNCVASGFHSQLEKDVLHYLLKGTQPIIVALARGLKKRLEPAFQKPMKEGRLLIVTPFTTDIRRVTEQTAAIRNEMMLKLADCVTLGYASKGGQLEKLLSSYSKPTINLMNVFNGNFEGRVDI